MTEQKKKKTNKKKPRKKEKNWRNIRIEQINDILGQNTKLKGNEKLRMLWGGRIFVSS